MSDELGMLMARDLAHYRNENIKLSQANVMLAEKCARLEAAVKDAERITRHRFTSDCMQWREDYGDLLMEIKDE